MRVSTRADEIGHERGLAASRLIEQQEVARTVACEELVDGIPDPPTPDELPRLLSVRSR